MSLELFLGHFFTSLSSPHADEWQQGKPSNQLKLISIFRPDPLNNPLELIGQSILQCFSAFSQRFYFR